MRKLILFVLFIPLLGFAQKTIVNATRVFPKADKISEFEKALAAHAQKYHKGDWSWRVYDIQTGPDVGGYHIVEGPSTWDALDGRGNLGAEHMNDWNKNVSIYLTDRSKSSYTEFVDSLSTVTLGDYSEKVVITHAYPKPGMIAAAMSLIKKLKPVWTASDERVAVYINVASGAPEVATATRLKNGLKELSSTYRKPQSERFDAANGAGSWATYLEDYGKAIEYRWSELLVYRPDLGSK